MAFRFLHRFISSFEDATANFEQLEPLLPANLVPVAKSAAYSANPLDLVLATGAFTVTLPPAPVNGTRIAVVALTGNVTVARSGSDTITNYSATGLTSVTVPAGSNVQLLYAAGVWYVLSGFVSGSSLFLQLLSTQQLRLGNPKSVTITWPGGSATTNFTVAPADFGATTNPVWMWAQPGGHGSSGFLRLVVGLLGNPTTIFVEADAAPANGHQDTIDVFALF